MQPVTTIHSRTIVLATRDIDTDQIIPARYLTSTERQGFGKALFHDLRYDKNGDVIADFPLNKPEAAGCEVLVAGNNFGCGSSREHAPWAMLDYGIRAVISTEIADIFRNNALKNGLIPIVVDTDTHAWLLEHPGVEVDIDVRAAKLTITDDREVHFQIDAFARFCLVEGIDQLGFLQKQLEAIQIFEEKRSWKP